MELIVYENIPCPILLMKESDTFLILFKGQQKWIFKCSLGYGEIIKDQYGIYYYFNGKYHREDGPACEYFDGDKYWYKNGKKHREDGPAQICYDGNQQYWINGNFISEIYSNICF